MILAERRISDDIMICSMSIIKHLKSCLVELVGDFRVKEMSEMFTP